jgi:hypothetical protein
MQILALADSIASKVAQRHLRPKGLPCLCDVCAIWRCLFKLIRSCECPGYESGIDMVLTKLRAVEPAP